MKGWLLRGCQAVFSQPIRPSGAGGGCGGPEGLPAASSLRGSWLLPGGRGNCGGARPSGTVLSLSWAVLMNASFACGPRRMYCSCSTMSPEHESPLKEKTSPRSCCGSFGDTVGGLGARPALAARWVMWWMCHGWGGGAALHFCFQTVPWGLKSPVSPWSCCSPQPRAVPFPLLVSFLICKVGIKTIVLGVAAGGQGDP